MSKNPREGLFIRLNAITIIAVYLLILVGGIVRSTGSGMGCPEWPKCFGTYVPPTNVNQLPENYIEIYLSSRVESNKHFVDMLKLFGFNVSSNEFISSDPIIGEQEFNVLRIWAEYVSRLLGVIVGLLIFLCSIVSFGYIKVNKQVFILSILTLILVLFLGWTGLLNVSTNLFVGLISFHMIMSIGLIGLLIYIRFSVVKNRINGIISHKPYKVKRLLMVCMILFFAQVLMGTQVREAIDTLALSLGEKERFRWIDELGIIFYVHRSYSMIMLLMHGYLIFRLSKSVEDFDTSKYLVWGLLGLIAAEIVTGTILSNFAMPFYIQPLHLLLALMIYGIQYFLFLIIKEKTAMNESLSNG